MLKLQARAQPSPTMRYLSPLFAVLLTLLGGLVIFYALGRDFLPARYFRGARSYHVNRSPGFARESPTAPDCTRRAPAFSEFSARSRRRARIGT